MVPSSPHTRRRRAFGIAVSAAVVAALALPVSGAAVAADGGLADSDLFLNPWSTTLEAAQGLTGQSRDDAQLLGSIPSADWFTKGTPAEVQAAVDEVVTAASAKGEMPVIVAYNLPFRDCAQYSSGGALDTAAYKAWIDGFAAGIGGRPATVILEPDGLGIIPHYTTLDNVTEWCQPAELDPATATSDRFEQLNYAVDEFAALASTSVYLDGTGASWLNVGEISDRLLKGGVQNADGFFLNASNYQFTANSTYFGSWVSKCIAFVTEAGGSFAECGNQYWNGGPANNWGGDWPAGYGGAMSQYAEWSAGSADPALNVDGVESRYASQLGGIEPTTRFVIDTSRNGLGPWQFPAGEYPAPEDWCNPPDRGLGLLPNTSTGVALVDAYLWIKVPGESDGKCFRGTPGPLDPERGMEDPAAGQWFVEQARELIALSNPHLAPLDCHVDWSAKGAGKAFATTVRVNGEASSGWSLEFAERGGQTFTKAVGGSVSQAAGTVTVTGGTGKGAGKATSTVLHAKGSPYQPWQFHLDGRACTS
ncbi:glycoside hydrolase family 6 protein [Microbacterium lacus]|uniref:glycoside hydrolase family 6 protein n=1 Tax=Microbacterium lacus TaxID=415217 RepID=UPI00384E3B75